MIIAMTVAVMLLVVVVAVHDRGHGDGPDKREVQNS